MDRCGGNLSQHVRIRSRALDLLAPEVERVRSGPVHDLAVEVAVGERVQALVLHGAQEKLAYAGPVALLHEVDQLLLHRVGD